MSSCTVCLTISDAMLTLPGTQSAILISQRRGDAVPKLFADVTRNKSNDETLKVFMSLREAINIIFPFVGLPNCIPACLGLVAAMRTRGISAPAMTRLGEPPMFTMTRLMLAIDRSSTNKTGWL